MAVSTQIAVIGVGNEFRHDDGFGWAVVDRLRERAADRPLPPGTVLAVCDGDPGRLIGLWENAALAVVLDAAHGHPAHPGRVHRLELEGAALARTGTTSSHGLGLGEAVELSRILGRLPEQLVVYAVEGADDSLGRGLSDPVAAQIAPVVMAVEHEIVRHRDAAAHGSGGGTAEGGGTPP
ncbi:hydrogenase maturation protease [Streptomyces sp. GC420]|uniref:hydrogenase maturation protease n=1 Tax=Streptomyces sp. GC420 TaxID=2697568 RepID=UPI001415090A|nr:hydrogenase maturation protease [Streptomyces sp. GC420]NBM20444.1 hydrogenase maturation protease [Streptomyces sp. GC420]